MHRGRHVAWNVRGGGLHANGGANFFRRSDFEPLTEGAYFEEIKHIMCNTETDKNDPHVQRWLDFLKEDLGFEIEEPCLEARDGDVAGTISFTWLELRKKRLDFIKDLMDRYPNVEFIQEKVVRANFDGNSTLKSITSASRDSFSRKFAVLSAGVFGTFDILLNSGIGP